MINKLLPALAVALLAFLLPALAADTLSTGQVTTSAPTYVTGTTRPISLDTTGNVRVSATMVPAGTQDVNVKQINGVTVLMGNGASGTGSQRVTIASDSTGIVALTTGSAQIGHLEANQSSNVAQINGVTPLMGAGNTGTGSPRVTISTDQAALPTWGHGATGAAPPANATYSGGVTSGATGGLLAGIKICDTHAKYDASDTGSITLVTGVASRKVYICSWILATGGTATNLKLREGSDANCVTNAADLTPAYQLVANDKIGVSATFWNGLAVSTNAYYVCVNASAANAHQAEIWYTIQ